MGSLRPRVLVIGMVDSIHLARWLTQFQGENLEFFLFPSGPNRRIHPELLRLIGDNQGTTSFHLHPVARFSVFLWTVDRFLGLRIRATILGRWLRQIKPSFVHAIEIQGAGYLALAVEATLRALATPLLVTNWGSDIYWFQRDKGHAEKIRRLLSIASHYSAECERDILLAKQLGFLGLTLPVIPNAGGLETIEELDFGQQSLERNLIAVKGYDGWVGRARVALRALELIESHVATFEIVVFSANFRTRVLAAFLDLSSNLKLKVFPKNRLTHASLQELFRRSVIYLGVSKSDGISTSMLEAMAAGAIPVQTSTSCCDEWFTSSGVAIETIEVEAVAAAIVRGLELAKDPRNATRNLSVIKSKASKAEVSKIAKEHYTIVLATSTK